MKNFSISILLVILFSSCGRNILFEKVDHISDEKWASDHILKYQFKIVDTTQFMIFSSMFVIALIIPIKTYIFS